MYSWPCLLSFGAITSRLDEKHNRNNTNSAMAAKSKQGKVAKEDSTYTYQEQKKKSIKWIRDWIS